MPNDQFTNDRAVYYKPSGKAPLLGIATMLLLGLSGGLVVADLYAHADVFSPLIYLNMALVVATGFAVGYLTAFGSRLGKVRNPAITFRAALFVALVSYLVMWSVWLWLVATRFDEDPPTLRQMLANPASFLSVLAWAFEHGTWSFSHGDFGQQGIGYQVRGILLVLVWIGEAVAFFGVAIFIAGSKSYPRPFCEHCNRWCRRPGVIHLYRGIISAAEMKIRLEARDWQYLASLPPPLYGERARLELSLESCPTCGDSHFLTLSRLTTSRNRKLLEAPKRMALVQKLIVSAEDVESIRSCPPFEPQESAEARVEELGENFWGEDGGEPEIRPSDDNL